MTTNSFSSVSLDPPLVLLSIARSAASFAAMEQAHRYAVHILHRHQHAISRAFAHGAADGGEKFGGVRWYRRTDGLPLLHECLARIECTITERIQLGDHVGHVARVDPAAAERAGAPLAFFRGDYTSLGG